MPKSSHNRVRNMIPLQTDPATAPCLFCLRGSLKFIRPCRYGAEEPDAFWPRTHASMFFQSGSSWDANCLPPW